MLTAPGGVMAGHSVRTAASGVAATALAATAALTGCSSTPSPQPTAQAYLSAWSAGHDGSAARHTDDPAAAAKALDAFGAQVHARQIRAEVRSVDVHGDDATATFAATITTAGLGAWSYTGRLQLHRAEDGWRVHWTPTDLHPKLTPTTHLAVRRSLPPRAPILDRHGRPLFAERRIVTVGVEPSRLKGHEAGTVGVLAKTLDIDARALRRAITAAKPDAFVPVIRLRRPAYEQVKPVIYPLPGTVFTTGTAILPPTTGFALPLLGSVGEATADVLQTNNGRYAAGDQVGLSGLQEAFQHRLSGTASGSIVVEATADDAVVATLHEFAGTAGRPVRTTLDQRVQQAAEDALAETEKPAALVAVRPSDGSILAAASTPDTTSDDRALTGHYPPGSTFKVVTTYALLGAGVTPQTTVPCPASVTIDGRQFVNFEHEQNGAATFGTDFAMSCNTAFIGASRRLSSKELADAAAVLGIGAKWSLPVEGFSGSLPPPAMAVEKAADAIGQGRVEVSPLTMALVAGAVQAGTWRPPVLVTDPPQQSDVSVRRLDAARVRTLGELMRRVVTSGTAANAGLPAGTAGKTGTAEFGTANPPNTHAWFLGFRGNLAFAVLVDGGGVGGAVAAPIAAQFLRRLG